MRNGKIILVNIMAAMALALSVQVCADVYHSKDNGPDLITFVSDDSWQPDNFDNGTAVLAIHMIDAGITLDGKTDEFQWGNAVEVTVPLSYGDVREVSVKALYTDKEVFLSLRWPDETQDRDHHPWTWDTNQQRYVESSQIEDSVLLSFEAGCEWTPSLLSGYMYDFDGWHWLAARSDPLGQALDLYGNTKNRAEKNMNYGAQQSRNSVDSWVLKFTENSHVDMYADWNELDRMYLKQAVSNPIYIRALPDGFRPPAYFELLPPPAIAPGDEGQTYVQFSPVKLTGDAGEVSAKGHWEDGFWTVEFRRVLRTPVGTIYDTVFNRLVQFSIHVFDRTDQLNEVSESGRLFLKFQEPKLTLVKD